jgi:hypothetical protein
MQEMQEMQEYREVNHMTKGHLHENPLNPEPYARQDNEIG